MSWAALIVTFALVDNVVLSRLLGTMQPPGAPGTMKAAVGLGAGTGILIACAALGGWAADSLVLDPLGISFLRTPVYLFLVAGLAWLFSEIVRRAAPGSISSVGFSFPEAAINSAALGAVLIIRRGGYSAAEGAIAGLAAGIGYGLVHLLLSAIRQRLDVERVPRAMRGLPLHLVSAGLLAYAFLAFDRAFLARALGG